MEILWHREWSLFRVVLVHSPLYSKVAFNYSLQGTSQPSVQIKSLLIKIGTISGSIPLSSMRPYAKQKHAADEEAIQPLLWGKNLKFYGKYDKAF